MPVLVADRIEFHAVDLLIPVVQRAEAQRLRGGIDAHLRLPPPRTVADFSGEFTLNERLLLGGGCARTRPSPTSPIRTRPSAPRACLRSAWKMTDRSSAPASPEPCIITGRCRPRRGRRAWSRRCTPRNWRTPDLGPVCAREHDHRRRVLDCARWRRAADADRIATQLWPPAAEFVMNAAGAGVM